MNEDYTIDDFFRQLEELVEELNEES